MKVGMVCPYSFDVPGGVQFHVRDLTEYLLGLGHEVEVLAPADDDLDLPAYLTSSGRAVPVRYNGSVARLTFGPVTSARTTRWLEQGDFDVVHIHEPVTPSVSVLTLWATDAPVVATFHTSNLRSRAMQAAYPLLRPSLEKIVGRIAVSEAARRTVTSHLGGDAVVIPNGVCVDDFARAEARDEWRGTPSAPTLAFLGRIDEPRKGLPVISAAMERILRDRPRARLLIAGPGDVAAARERMSPQVGAACTFLGLISDEDKAALFASVDAYVAPHTGGESFGIVLVEAMAAGAPVVASDLAAFTAVLDGQANGRLFTTGDPDSCAAAVLGLLGDDAERARLRSAGQQRARRYDWPVVAAQILAVYETVTQTADAAADVEETGLWSRIVRPRRRSEGGRG
ncbi:glycosyltransferase [Nostocoides sp. F2B08]|uniref:glycosyltransferase family 4 protein n=1 Tax=Nostocoides sp. F2B08 TaxID=2653936 RepID=UPI001263D747|nr:glycosyltransferase family 4 protein [Tetrasphaera sp. F2B08]KAB7743065.1 glycosyltransferase [Tetrasphaera sp. F2B08]